MRGPEIEGQLNMDEAMKADQQGTKVDAQTKGPENTPSDSSVKDGLFNVAENRVWAMKPSSTNREIIERPLKDHFYDHAKAITRESYETDEEYQAKLKQNQPFKEVLQERYAYLFKTPGNLRLLAEAYQDWMKDPLFLDEVKEFQAKREYQTTKLGGAMKDKYISYDVMDKKEYNPVMMEFLHELADKIEAEESAQQERYERKSFKEELAKKAEAEAFSAFRSIRIPIEEDRQPTLEEFAHEIISVYLRNDLSMSEKNKKTAQERDIFKKSYIENIPAEQRIIIADALLRDARKADLELMKLAAEFGMQERTDEERKGYEKRKEDTRRVELLYKITHKLI